MLISVMSRFCTGSCTLKHTRSSTPIGTFNGSKIATFPVLTVHPTDVREHEKCN